MSRRGYKILQSGALEGLSSENALEIAQSAVSTWVNEVSERELLELVEKLPKKSIQYDERIVTSCAFLLHFCWGLGDSKHEILCFLSIFSSNTGDRVAIKKWKKYQ